MEIPAHAIELGYTFIRKAGVKADKRQVKFMIADHVAFINSLGGVVTWPKPVTGTEPSPIGATGQTGPGPCPEGAGTGPCPEGPPGVAGAVGQQ